MREISGDKPIYKKLIGIIEDDILNETYKEDEIIISTTQISKQYEVNSTTAMKTISVLKENGIIYKKRGIGMAVTSNSRSIILSKRKMMFMDQLLPELILEAGKLDISKKELATLILKGELY
ncbi:GntR family transcriptional regulator [Tannockella kyphosi]|uniref:GntR family transcriptional regulator n=1 Tax=Tannockella kyphosi TaxID=2899121 RepID=UPI0020122071|nr:GntR family transcriptional regulator [Tannockella kyphosi]